MNKLILKKTLFVFMILMSVSCHSQSDFIRTSNEISKREPLYDSDIIVQVSKKAKQVINKSRKLRNKLYRKGKISFFTTLEPLFIIQGYDIETDDTLTEIWNSIGSISYLSNDKDYEIDDEDYYSEDLKLLIKDWKIETIEQNQKEKSVYGALSIYVISIYFSENGEINETKIFSFSQYDGCMKEHFEYEEN